MLSWHHKIKHAILLIGLNNFYFSKASLFISGQLCSLKDNNNIHLKHSARLNNADVKKTGKKRGKIKAVNVTQVA